MAWVVKCITSMNVELVKVDGSQGIIVRNMVNGEISRHAADNLTRDGQIRMCSSSINAQGCNVTATYRLQAGAGLPTRATRKFILVFRCMVISSLS